MAHSELEARACQSLYIMIFDKWAYMLSESFQALENDLDNAPIQDLTSTSCIERHLDALTQTAEAHRRLLKRKTEAWVDLCRTSGIPLEATEASSEYNKWLINLNGKVKAPLSHALTLAKENRSAKSIKKKMDEARRSLSDLQGDIHKFIVNETSRISSNSSSHSYAVPSSYAAPNINSETKPKSGASGVLITIICAILGSGVLGVVTKKQYDLKKEQRFAEGRRDDFVADFLTRHSKVENAFRSLIKAGASPFSQEQRDVQAEALLNFYGGTNFNGGSLESSRLTWSGLLGQIQSKYKFRKRGSDAMQAIIRLESKLKQGPPYNNSETEDSLNTLRQYVIDNNLRNLPSWQ